MKNSLASIEVKALVDELQMLVNGRLDNVYNPSKDEILLKIYVSGLGNKMLRIVSGKMMYLTEYKAESEQPTGFALTLRKHLNNSRLKSIEMKGFERVVEFVFDKKNDYGMSTHSLVVELFGMGNIVLLKDKTVVAGLHYTKQKERSTLANKEYIFPERKYNVLKMGVEAFTRFVKDSEQESIVKALAIDLGLGGVYAEELCEVAGIDKNAKPGELTKVTPLFKALDELRTKKPKGIIYVGKDIVPFEMKGFVSLKKLEFPTYNEALDNQISKQIVEETVSKEQKEYLKKVEKLNTIISSQETSVKKLKESQELAQKKAELIYTNYQVVKEVIDEINKASRKMSWDEIKSKLKEHKIVKEIDAKNKTVTVELE